MFTEAQGRQLLILARTAIAREFDEPAAPPPHADWLDAHGATFVTLTKEGRLRGCIGSLEAHRPLREDVEENARAAAFRDPRFPPLLRGELNEVKMEVSVLTPATPMTFSDEAEALRQLRPEVDGVILEYGWHRSTFLPQVWEQLPEPHQFLSHLKQKAGLSGDFWSKDLRLSRYTVEKFKEER